MVGAFACKLLLIAHYFHISNEESVRLELTVWDASSRMLLLAAWQEAFLVRIQKKLLIKSADG